MDVLDNTVNRRANEGYLPVSKLCPFFESMNPTINFEEKAQFGMDQLRETPEMFFTILTLFKEAISGLEEIKGQDVYNNEINVIINTKCYIDTLTVNSYLEAFTITPVITLLDKMLWYGAFSYSMNIVDREPEISESMMLSWIYLLLLLQKKELRFSKTINIEQLSSSERILEIITGNWESEKPQLFIELTDSEKSKLSNLNNKREKLIKQIHKEWEEGKKYAEKTKDEWITFIDIINDLAEKENAVSREILAEASPKDKLFSINEYNSVLRGIERGHYNLDGRTIQLVELFGTVNKRMKNAPAFSKAYETDKEPFVLSPVLLSLVMNPMTFNYLFITFHNFRLSPNKETAKKFVSVALHAIKNNLGGEKKEWISINDMISDFYSTVMSFVNKNKKAIENLSFEKLQNDAVVTHESYQNLLSADAIEEFMGMEISQSIENGLLDERLERLFTTGRPLADKKELMLEAEQMDSRIENIDSSVIARSVIVSLNIIYLFCDALRIMLNNKRAHIKIDSETVGKYRRELLNLDDYLIHKVYSHLGEMEMGMLEYREKAGIISNTLSDQEKQEEELRNTTFSIILKNAIWDLIDQIEDQNTDEIIKTKARIKEEIKGFPGCDEKEQYAEWLDSISTLLSDALIKSCKLQKDNFDVIKKNLLESMGDKSANLPLSAVDSLTTAEMLYDRYATDEYAKKGFDYSCISALYYQAFEDAYNELIWKDYAERLNKLIIGDELYIERLTKKNKRSEPAIDFLGYLHNDYGRRKLYIQFPSKDKDIITTTVSLRCMYKGFALLLECITEKSEIEKFCDYFARLTGYEEKAKMLGDTAFMKKCREFEKNVKDSIDNRNNASHGGTSISKDQCASDKKTVLNDLEKVRSTSIGLIQQLLYLLYKE